MFLRKHKSQGPSAAWRIAIWPTVAFALGSAIAFAIMYLLIAKDIRERSDAWLSGEAEVLADVSANTPRDALYDRLVEEVAELASREVPDTSDAAASTRASVFFLQDGTAAGTHLGGADSQGTVYPGGDKLPLAPGSASQCSRAGMEKGISGCVSRRRRTVAGCIWDLPTSAARRCWID